MQVATDKSESTGTIEKLEAQITEYQQKYGFSEGMGQKLKKLPHQINSLTDHKRKLEDQLQEDSNNDKVSALALANIRKAIENTEREISEANKQLEALEIATERPEYIEYTKLLLKYNELKPPKQSTSSSHMSAKRTINSRWGKTDVTIGLLANLKGSKDWLDEFSKKHNLQITNSPSKLEFTSSEKGLTIEVTQEKISGMCRQQENKDSMVQVLVELYMQALDKNNIKHKIDSNDPSLQAQIEQALAKALTDKGMNSGTINDKPISSFTAKSSNTSAPMAKDVAADSSKTQPPLDPPEPDETNTFRP